MKKKIILAVAIVCLLCGCSKTIPTLQNGEEAIVKFKSGDMISVDELYNKLKDAYATEILIDMVDDKIFADKYTDELDDAKEHAENYINSIKKYYTDADGHFDEQGLNSAIKTYYGYANVEDFQEFMRLNYLRDLAVKDYAKTKISDSKIDKYYKETIVKDRELSHIQIIPEVTEDMTSTEKKEKEDEALKLAKEIIAKLKKGEKFEELAKKYSDDTATAKNGGKLSVTNKGEYGDDAFDKEAWTLEVGTYSKTPVKTESGYEIIYVNKENDKKPLKDIKDDIIDTLVDQLLKEDETLQVTGIKELRKEYGVDFIDDDIQSKYNKYIDNLYLQAEENH